MADTRNRALGKGFPDLGVDAAREWLDQELRDLRAETFEDTSRRLPGVEILADDDLATVEVEAADCGTDDETFDTLELDEADFLADDDFSSADDGDATAASPLGASPSFSYQSLAPPERVRFAAPVSLRPEGRERAFDAAIVNLSVQGVACLSPAELIDGQRVWASFGLNLGEKPLVLLCEVVWSQPPQQEHRAYGLRFVSLTRSETERLRQAVRERTEGRAGAWPLPVMPAEAEVPPPVRVSNPWLSAAAGMAAGIGLALALSVIPNASVGSPPPDAAAPAMVAGAASTATAEPSPAVAPVEASAPVPSGAPTKALVPGNTTHQTLGSIAVAPAAATPAERSPDLLPRRESSPETYADDILRPLSGGDRMPLALLADGPVEQHISFWLSDPQRLVIDIPGRQSGFARTHYVIDHPLASRLRIGNHRGKVRFVIETNPEVAAEVVTERRGNALAIELRRRDD